MKIYPENMIGKRVELMQAECWVGAIRTGNKSGHIRAGSRGTVKQATFSDRGGAYSVVHVDFDRIKPKGDYLFGVGYTDNGKFKVLQGTA